MIDIKIDNRELTELARKAPKETLRAAETALDKTAYEIRDAVMAQLPVVFDRPTRFTMRSLRVERTRRHNLLARVSFKDPERMSRHYLAPQVKGGPQSFYPWRPRGFERALGGRRFMPSRHTPLDRYGNLSAGKIRQILSVLGRAEGSAGYSANLTARSARKNRRDRDYVWLKRRHGKLPPGIYERFQTAAGFGARTKRNLPFGTWQKGRTRGGFSSVVRAKGLRPVLIEINQSTPVRPRLPFYEIAHKAYNDKFSSIFRTEFSRRFGQQQARFYPLRGLKLRW
jgi:hypothetical protein